MPEDWDKTGDTPEDDENDNEGGFNPEDFFNDMDFDDDDDDPISDEELQKEMDAYKELPVFKSAQKIRELTHRIVETFDESKDKFQLKQQMMMNAYTLEVKIAGAEAGDLFTLRMENAVVIKIHARELLAQTSLCKAENLCSREYLQLLRDEIDEFRKLFVEWVKSFDKFNDAPDEWGLFYEN
jgi:hypothetical protein